MVHRDKNFIKKIFSSFRFRVSSSKAFTLAEVLITLGIIGVVAAMTIPNLISNYQKQQYVTALKKAYATTNQALKQMAADYGCIDDLKCTGLFDTSVTNEHYVLGEAFVKYFRLVKNCKNTKGRNCFADETNEFYDGTYTGTNSKLDSSGAYKFITADGSSLAVYNYKNNCLTDGTGGSENWSTGRTGNMKQTCGFLVIDVNGLKKPNAYGRDTFFYWITNGKGAILYPESGADDKHNGELDYWWQDDSGKSIFCNKSNRYGYYCTGRVMEEGWQMNY